MGPKRQRSRGRLFAVAEGLPKFEALAEVATKRNLCLAIAVCSHVRLLLSRKDLVQPPASTRRNGCARRALEAGTFEYRARRASDSENLDRAALRARLGLA